MSPEEYNELTVAKLTEECAARGVKVPADAKKADIVAILVADDESKAKSDENSDDPSDLPPNGDGEETEEPPITSDDPSDLPPHGDGEENPEDGVAPLPIEEIPNTKVLPQGVKLLKAGTIVLLGNSATDLRQVVLAKDTEIYFADTERALVGLLSATSPGNISVNEDTFSLKYTADGSLAPLAAQTDEVTPEFLQKLDESEAHALGVLEAKRKVANE